MADNKRLYIRLHITRNDTVYIEHKIEHDTKVGALIARFDPNTPYYETAIVPEYIWYYIQRVKPDFVDSVHGDVWEYLHPERMQELGYIYDKSNSEYVLKKYID